MKNNHEMFDMEIEDGIGITGYGIHIKKENVLVISDLQIGYEQTLISAGVFIPKFQNKDMEELIKKTVNGRKFDKIVINGDFKHEFARINSQEWQDSLKIINLLKRSCKSLVLVKGNHDKAIAPIANKNGLEVVDGLLVGNVFLVHGDKLVDIPSEADIVVIGHEHPAVGLRKDDIRVERFKCFLKGRYKGKDIIVLPSFNPVTQGTDILVEKLLSPFLEKGLKNFEVYISEDKVYYFGLVKDLVDM